MLLQNKLKIALPCPRNWNLETKSELTYEQLAERADLELRAGIKHGAGESSGMKPLTPVERQKHRKYQAGKWASEAPRWDGREFKFAAAGEQGSIFDLEPSIALFLKWHYNRGAHLLCEKPGDEILHTMTENEQLPEGIVPVRLSVDDPMNFTSDSFVEYGKDGKVVRASRGRMEPRGERAIDLGPKATAPA